jgi:hypothetical protein
VCVATLVALQGCASSVAPNPSTTSEPSASSAVDTTPSASTATPIAPPASASRSPSPSGNPSPAFSPAAAHLRDVADGATFTIVIDRGDPQYGQASLAVPGLGLVRPASGMTVVVRDDGTVEATYDGVADLDSSATLDLDFGVATRSSGSSDQVSLTTRAVIEPNLVTGRVTLTVAGQRFVISDPAPSESAQGTLDALVLAMRRQDWHALYGLLSSIAARDLSEAAFAAQMRAGMEPYGRIVDTSAGTLAYQSEAYLDLATAPIAITFEKDGTRQETHDVATFVWEPGGWRFLTSQPPKGP